MEIFKRTVEDPQHAYDRVNEELLKVGSIALGSGASKKDVDRYNSLRAQKFEHRDGTRGHIHLNNAIDLFDAKFHISLPPKKIPYRLKSGTNIVIPV